MELLGFSQGPKADNVQPGEMVCVREFISGCSFLLPGISFYSSPTCSSRFRILNSPGDGCRVSGNTALPGTRQVPAIREEFLPFTHLPKPTRKEKKKYVPINILLDRQQMGWHLAIWPYWIKKRGVGEYTPTPSPRWAALAPAPSRIKMPPQNCATYSRGWRVRGACMAI